jgi:hypothetical protein
VFLSSAPEGTSVWFFHVATTAQQRAVSPGFGPPGSAKSVGSLASLRSSMAFGLEAVERGESEEGHSLEADDLPTSV